MKMSIFCCLKKDYFKATEHQLKACFEKVSFTVFSKSHKRERKTSLFKWRTEFPSLDT